MPTIEDEKVEQEFAHLQRFVSEASCCDLSNLQALVERIRVEIMVAKPKRATRMFYRAVIDYLEDVLEHRYAAEGSEPHHHHNLIGYVRSLLDAIES